MTGVMVALVLIVGAVAVTNLLLTIGVIRRLREHTVRLAAAPASGVMPPVMMGSGMRVGEFDAATTDGEPVSRSLLTGRTLLGVLSPRCGACEERLPEFISAARDFPGGREHVLAVLSGEPAEVEVFRDRLAAVAKVVIEPPAANPLASAMEVRAWPAFAVLETDGTVVASGPTISDLRIAPPAAAPTA